MKTPHVLRLEAVTNLVANREELSDEQLLALLCSALGIETLGQKRARAGRSGGLRSVESRREVSGSAQPKQVPKQIRSKPPDASEPNPEARAKQTPKQERSKQALASGLSLGSLPALPDSDPKEIAVVSEGSAKSSARATAAMRPRNYEEALAEPAAAVAMFCRDDGLYAGLIQVHRMPWVVEPIRAWHEAGGDMRPLDLEARDGEVTAVVTLTARGYLKSDLVRVARYLRGTEKYRDKVLASSMTKAVVDIGLAELNERRGAGATPFARDLVRRVDSSSRAPAALGDVLPRLASGDGE